MTAVVTSALALALVSCTTPVGADKAAASVVYRQTHDNAVSRLEPSRETVAVLRRFNLVQQFARSPQAVVELLHAKAMENSERGLLFALSELNYLAADQVRHSVKPWDTRQARDYFLAAAVYAWLFLFGDEVGDPPGPFDQRFRTACDIYNFSLGSALIENRSTNAVAVLRSGTRRLPVGQLELDFSNQSFPGPLEDYDGFVLAQQYLVRGLSVRNRQPGLGAPLVAVGKPDANSKLARCLPATVLLRLEGKLADLGKGTCRASLELYSTFETTAVRVGDREVPLETDMTVSVAYVLNQSLAWRLGMLQFLSFKEQVASDVYLTQPYRPGKVPVVFVHGTFSSPVWWAEMLNTLAADPELQKRCQFWYFIYNSGNPTSYSAVKLRHCLSEKIRSLDPEGKDPALRQMVVIGHSQGGLLAKLTGTDTGDQLLQAVAKTNRFDDLNLSASQQALLRKYLCFDALPFVSRVIFISTPHRGSYLASSFARRVARRLVSVPSRLVSVSGELAGVTDKLDIPKEFRGVPTSLDSMSPRNPVQLALADIPLAPHVKGNSIVAVKGGGDFHTGRDGLVAYNSAHVEYVESEFIVRGPHSCQGMPATIEEVRRILREHLSSPGATERPEASAPNSPLTVP